ncbi:c-type cytochrome [Halomonas korlensis]|uniref:Cytochrome c553 n=1 Tax=Halomonas korlensis TaxID=463301 RepID=A0A1I7IBN1_9GAMM|nr:c-type cytochrome [Halomonas korlensis]SFU70393.1 Cytochrome c553 [Halomonas korlensis]
MLAKRWPIAVSAIVVIISLGWLVARYGNDSSVSDAAEPSLEKAAVANPLTDPLYADSLGEIAAKANPENISDIVSADRGDSWACASCHGGQGQGAGSVPRLAGLPAGYITKQLHDYADGRRLNDNMQHVVSSLSDEDMAALGAYYSRLEAPGDTQPQLGGNIERGRTLALEGDWAIDVPACFSCHGSSGWGVGQSFPSLAGQHSSYTYIQLANWNNGKRNNSPIQLMRDIAQKLSDSDMRSVADFMATLSPPQTLGITRTSDDGSRTEVEIP